MNKGKQCRSASIKVGENGQCLVRHDSDDLVKSQIESYVDLTECLCPSCNYWEEDRQTQLGQCGLCNDLFFRYRKENIDQYPKVRIVINGPFCLDFEKQVDQPAPYQTS